ncbi:hypothetical protein RFI_22549 [Reticulomyxa filosa]|uniref:Fibronectin type-III domain-containing protein n=1 Tax=Reticulomyxa filosa TaxID=46433 RepID=X6MLC6_RETFI|nr:hypothetical protein RFI_22549 [Reticulomyxa filosa]|eukprot:ETO14818.1 hypothetical protein RFI_22549 [Reticulomyxa filosa]
MTNDSLKAIENNMKRYNEEKLQLYEMTSQKMWWFSVCVISPLSSSDNVEDLKQSDKEKVANNKQYLKVENNKNYIIVKELSKDTSYEICVQTCFEWPSINNLQQIDKKLESSWTATIRAKTHKNFEHTLSLQRLPLRPLFPHVTTFFPTEIHLGWKPAVFPPIDEKTTETTIDYVIREYNHHKGEVITRVKNESCCQIIGLKENEEYMVTISGVQCSTNEATEESWPVIFKTPPTIVQGETFELSQPNQIRLFYYNDNSKSSKCMCWSSPYQGIGIIGYEIEFSDNYPKASEKLLTCHSVWMPLTPTSNGYSLRIQTICEFNKDIHKSLPTQEVKIPAEMIIFNESKRLHYIFLLTNKQPQRGGFLLQPDIKGLLFVYLFVL